MRVSRLPFKLEKMREFMRLLAILSDRSSPKTKTFIPRMCLETKVLHIPPMPYQMSRLRARARVASPYRLDRIRLWRDRRDLALDLLVSCGMIHQSEERWLVGRKAQGSRGSLAITRASKPTARRLRSSAILPGIPGTLCQAWHENHVPVGEPFWSNPASKRKDLAATIRLLSGHASR